MGNNNMTRSEIKENAQLCLLSAMLHIDTEGWFDTEEEDKQVYEEAKRQYARVEKLFGIQLARTWT